MKQLNWSSLFIRYGFQIRKGEVGYSTKELNPHDSGLFLKVLLDTGVEFTMVSQQEIVFNSTPVEEKIWAKAVEKRISTTGESLYSNNLLLKYLDVYLSGILIQLNRLGIPTIYSCDGHGKRRPLIDFVDAKAAKLGALILSQLGANVRRNLKSVRFIMDREELPEYAEKLSNLSIEDVEVTKRNSMFSFEDFQQSLELLLSKPGRSGNEGLIRTYVQKELSPHVDNLMVDHAGNLLAMKVYGPGPTVLVNAHLDTVQEIDSDREIVKEAAIWKSSKGILGADDRAGVNVVLSIAKTIGSTGFNGTIKYIFTVEEEIGLLGAKNISESFLWDIDMAFVVDRRGTHDIVTSCGGFEEFCSPLFGRQLERIARSGGFGEWKTTTGGSSDTRIWASNGIQSVNLSVGYLHEHSEDEELDTEACYDTYEYLLEVLHQAERMNQRLQSQVEVQV